VTDEEFVKYGSALTAAEALFLKSMDAADHDNELRDATAPFEAGGALQYAPPEYRQRAEADVKGKQKQRAGEALFQAEHVARRVEVSLEPVIAAAKEPPAPLAALFASGGGVDALKVPNVTLGERMQLDLLDETRRARFDRDYGNAKPSAILAYYSRALTDATNQANASFIRWVEGRHRTTWTGAPIGNDATEAIKATDLAKAIEAARETRIPDDVRELRESVERVYRRADAAKNGGVRSLRPVGWKA
jgi:hypothetical protein